MKIRTQLVLAFFLLAIVPLAVIVLFSYATSLRAVRSAVAEESLALAGEMDDRLSSVRRDLSSDFARLGEFPFLSLSPEVLDGEAPGPLIDELVLAMGDTARLVQSLEFVPAEEGARLGEALGAGLGFPPAPVAPGPPGRPAPEAPGGLVIDVPRILAEIRASRVAGVEAGDVEEGAAVGLAVEVLGEIAEELAAQSAELEEEMHRLEEEGAGDPAAREEIEAALEAQREARHQIKLRLKDAIEARRRLSDEERAAIDARRREQRLLFGQEFQVPVEREGEVVGHVTACVAGRDLLADVLERSTREEGEVPFAIDREGNLYTVDEEDKAVVEGLDLRPPEEGAETSEGGRWMPAAGEDEWVVATSEDDVSGLTFGIARPIRQSLSEVRQTAARNFGFGLGLIVLGLLGIQPLSRRMTRHLDAVARGAERIARGDLTTRVPVSSTSELGRLATAFNRMAEDLSHHQEREVRQRVLEAEYARKSEELEEARRFQLSLLPRCLPEQPDLELAVAMTTATEVGGDFYDFLTPEEGALTTVVGDATGHGARAGTMVTMVKSLLIADAGASAPAEFLRSANRAIRRMRLERMAMALLIARFDREPSGRGGRLTVASAGMPPALVHRRGSGEVEELELSGMPLGGLDDRFRELSAELSPGDTVLLMSDGFPELPDRGGDPLGYAAARRCFADVAGRPPDRVITALQSMARKWADTDGPPADDMTFVVLRVRGG